MPPSRPSKPDPRAVALEAVTSVSLKFEPDGSLTEPALRRLSWRLARAGKTCEVCRQEKRLSDFGRDVHESDGMNRKCRECRRGKRKSEPVRS